MRIGIRAVMAVELLSIVMAGNAAYATDLTTFVTATQDGGTAKTNFAWYEEGFNPSAPTAGLPHPGIIHGLADPDSTFLLRPYDANNVLLLDAASPNGRLTLVTPVAAKSLEFATTSGFGPGSVHVVVHYNDDGLDSEGSFLSPDWFAAGRTIVHARDRVNVMSGKFDAPFPQISGTPDIWEEEVSLDPFTSHLVSSVDLTWSPPPGILGTHTSIFGISVSEAANGFGAFTAVPLTADSFNQDVVVEASAAPEPSAPLAFIAFGSLILRRRTLLSKRPWCATAA